MYKKMRNILRTKHTDLVRNDELFIVEKDFRETFEAEGLDDRN